MSKQIIPTPIIIGFGAAMAGLAGLESPVSDMATVAADDTSLATFGESNFGNKPSEREGD